MNNYLKELGYTFWDTTIDLTPGLERLLSVGKLTHENDLIELIIDGNTIPSEHTFNDVEKCEYESFENHFHIDDYTPHKMNFNDIHFLGLGLEFFKRMTQKVKDDLPELDVRLFLSYGKVEDEDVYEFGNCVIRFYKIRPSAESIFGGQDLNDFKEEGVIELDIIQSGI